MANHGRAVRRELVPPGAIIPSKTGPQQDQIVFSRYQEDGSLRLFKQGSMLGDEPAGYSEDPVVVKILVRRPDRRGSFMVCLPVRRAFLDQPNAEQILAERAWEWRD